MRKRWMIVTVLASAAIGLSACADHDTSGGAPTTAPAASSSAASQDEASAASADGASTEAQKFPKVVDATADCKDRVCDFSVTISSPYDTPDRYADGWRLLGEDGTEIGTHTLDHDHASEQPFTRVQTGVQIPDGVRTVTVEGRDQKNGYGGATAEVTIE